MSDLAATNCGCGCDNGCDSNNVGLFGGNGCSSMIWLLVILSCCCGGGRSGDGYGCGCGCDNSCLIAILLLACCGGCGF